MYLENEIMRYLQHMNQQLGWQAQQLQTILSAIKRLEKEVQELKAIRLPTIDKVEYNFDQLKVEKLEGTLNVGLTPGLSGDYGQYVVNGQNFEDLDIKQSAPVPADTIQGRVIDRVRQYLDRDAEAEIITWEQRHQFALEEDFRIAMLDDLRKQADERISHYLQINRPEFINEEGKESWVYDKVKGDIQMAIRNYFDRVHPMGQGGGQVEHLDHQ